MLSRDTVLQRGLHQHAEEGSCSAAKSEPVCSCPLQDGPSAPARARSIEVDTVSVSSRCMTTEHACVQCKLTGLPCRAWSGGEVALRCRLRTPPLFMSLDAQTAYAQTHSNPFWRDICRCSMRTREMVKGKRVDDALALNPQLSAAEIIDQRIPR